MHHINKSLIVVFAILAILGANLLLINPVNAQTVTTPSVPEFTVKYVDRSYDVPTTTTIDPYSGSTITHQGYHVENRTIEVTITNQPLASNQSNELYLNIRTKGPYTNEWTTIYTADTSFLRQASGETTTVVYSLDANEYPFWDSVNKGFVEFQVEALVGSVHRSSIEFAAPFVFEGQESGWSNTKSVTVPEPATTTPAAPSSTPTPTETTADNLQANSLTGGQSLTSIVIVAAAAIGAIIAGSLIIVIVKRQISKPVTMHS